MERMLNEMEVSENISPDGVDEDLHKESVCLNVFLLHKNPISTILYLFPFQCAVSRNAKQTQTKSSQKVLACVYLSLIIYASLS